MIALTAAAAATRYPGRGIVLGLLPDGRALIAYFIMGRSVNSRNRVFVPDGAGIRTQAHDPSRMVDPSLVIYAPVRVLDNMQIVTNGDQTDTIFDVLTQGGTFEDALRARAYEPDAPNYTPRVSGLLALEGGAFSYKLAILRKGCGCERFFFEYEAPQRGVGHFLHTYAGDGDPIPPFAGEPETVALPDGDVAEALFASLDPDNRVALFVRLIDPATGRWTDRIINKLEAES